MKIENYKIGSEIFRTYFNVAGYLTQVRVIFNFQFSIFNFFLFSFNLLNVLRGANAIVLFEGGREVCL